MLSVAYHGLSLLTIALLVPCCSTCRSLICTHTLLITLSAFVQRPCQPQDCEFVIQIRIALSCFPALLLSLSFFYLPFPLQIEIVSLTYSVCFCCLCPQFFCCTTVLSSSFHSYYLTLPPHLTHSLRYVAALRFASLGSSLAALGSPLLSDHHRPPPLWSESRLPRSTRHRPLNHSLGSPRSRQHRRPQIPWSACHRRFLRGRFSP